MKDFMREGVRIRKFSMVIQTNQPTNKTLNPKKQNQTLLRSKSEGVYLYFLTLYFSICDARNHLAKLRVDRLGVIVSTFKEQFRSTCSF